MNYSREVQVALVAFTITCLATTATAGESPSPAAEQSTSVVAKVESAIERGAKAAASGIERGAKAAEHGIKVGIQAAARGIETGAKAVARVAETVAEKVRGQ
jgi:formiminotetrahydrofolate cyclodeaminase